MLYSSIDREADVFVPWRPASGHGSWCLIAIALTLFSLFLGHAAAQVDWPSLQLNQLVSGAASPVQITNARDGSGRLFVVEQAGRIRIIQNGAFLATAFLDISGSVLAGGPNGEEGMLAVAFPPNYATKRYFYVSYTRATDGATVISRFSLTANANVADSASESVILAIPQPYPNHKSGQLAFGPDGYLYIGVGDGGSEGDPGNEGQTTSTLLGKLLRIDTEGGVTPYAVPPTNPFVNNPAFRPEIWAWGLRNPWRFSFDRQTGDLYIGDVGQDAWEEIDVQPASSTGGQNYGWRVKEGSHDYIVPSGFDESTLTDPVAQFQHNFQTGAYCVIGGYVCRGSASSRMNGIYIFGDYSTGNVWGMKYDGSVWRTQKLLSYALEGISSFGEDEVGNVYVADIARGGIYQIQDTLVAAPPTFNPPGGTYPTLVNVQVSSDSNSTIYYTLDGSTPTTASPHVTSGGFISVTTGVVLNAMAVKTGLTNSPVATATYSFQAGTPQFTPSSSPLFGATLFSMSTATPGATIYYTLDGSTPTTASPVYTAPFTITPPVTVQAKAVSAGFADSTIAKNFYALSILEQTTVTTVAGNGQRGFINGPGASAEFFYPIGVCVDTSGNLYVADAGNNMIRKIAPSGDVSTFAGSTTGGLLDGLGTAAKFYQPEGICMAPSGNIFVTDIANQAARKIDPTGQVTTISAAYALYANAGAGIVADVNDTVYIGDWGRIVKALPTSEVVIAGPGAGTWQSSIGLALFAGGQFYVSNRASQLSIVSPSGVITAFAGQPSLTGYSDGPSNQAIFQGAGCMCLDSRGNLYVCDYYRVRKVRPNGLVSTLAGTGQIGFADGPGSSATFGGVTGICVDSKGVVFVTDTQNHAVRKITQYDWDEDGIPDALEGGSTPYVVGVDDRIVDSDGDGISNAVEFIAGTNPLDPSSRFQISSLAPDTSGKMGVSWPAVAGKRYQVQFSSDLTTWQNLGPVAVGDGTVVTVPDPSTSGVSQRFYRVVVGVP